MKGLYRRESEGGQKRNVAHHEKLVKSELRSAATLDPNSPTIYSPIVIANAAFIAELTL
jgi:hypothetical protein